MSDTKQIWPTTRMNGCTYYIVTSIKAEIKDACLLKITECDDVFYFANHEFFRTGKEYYFEKYFYEKKDSLKKAIDSAVTSQANMDNTSTGESR